jgi:hypothetical protein
VLKYDYEHRRGTGGSGRDREQQATTAAPGCGRDREQQATTGDPKVSVIETIIELMPMS